MASTQTRTTTRSKNAKAKAASGRKVSRRSATASSVTGRRPRPLDIFGGLAISDDGAFVQAGQTMTKAKFRQLHAWVNKAAPFVGQSGVTH